MIYQHLYAELYDELGADVFTAKAVENIFRILDELQFQPRTILDLGCGTGIATKILAERGYRVIGLDNSQSMLVEAKAKLSDERVLLIQSDIKNFTLPYKVDLVISISDVLNYLLSYHYLVKAFKSICENLEDNGLFIFDMNTETNLKMWHGTQITDRPAWLVISEGRYNPNRRLGKMKMQITKQLEDGTFEQSIEEHIQRAYTEAQIRRALNYAKFRPIDFRTYDYSIFKNTYHASKLVGIVKK